MMSTRTLTITPILHVSGMGTKTKKSPAGKKSKSPVRNGKSVDFKVTNGIASGNATAKTEPNAMNSNGNGKAKSGLKHSPSARTLSRVERDKVVLWMKPWIVLPYAIMEILHLAAEGIHSLLQHKLVLFVISIISAIGAYGYITPGEHQALVIEAEKSLLWWGWWLLLGILSSIGFGSGLHTFLIYLGPHIAAVTLAAYECNSLDFPEPPYPESIVCPDVKSAAAITLWDIVAKVRVEALLWGAGTAIGELPPYFMARAARLSGDEPEDEEYKEFIEMMNTDRRGNSDEMSLVDRTKLMAEQFISKVGFPGILLFASIPNPLFDLAGITCGHFLVPFWSFFGATLIGKAIVKMHVQMLFVIIAFSEHHVEEVVNLLARIPNVGEYIRQPIKDFLAKQKVALHRTPGTHVNQESTLVQEAMGWIVTTMILFFLMSIVNSLAQQYHKRRFERSQRSL